MGEVDTIIAGLPRIRVVTDNDGFPWEETDAGGPYVAFADAETAVRAAALPDPPTDNPYRDEYGNHLPGEAGTAAGYDEGWAAREAAALPDAAKLLRYEAAACEARGHRDNAGCYRLGATFLERAAADREAPDGER